MLDEHTAALDPQTASKVLSLTDKLVNDGGITTLMITHNMRDAITYGNRLIMMNKGEIVFDISGEAKHKLTIEELIKKCPATAHYCRTNIISSLVGIFGGRFCYIPDL